MNREPGRVNVSRSIHPRLWLALVGVVSTATAWLVACGSSGNVTSTSSTTATGGGGATGSSVSSGAGAGGGGTSTSGAGGAGTGGSCQAGSVQGGVISFDNVPDQTALTDQYISQGLSFSGPAVTYALFP